MLPAEARQPLAYLVCGQAASLMSGDRAQAHPQPVQPDVVAIRELIEQPKDAMYVETLGDSEFTKAAVAGEQCPLS